MQVPERRGTDRRSFLKGAVLVGAGAAATGLVAACSPSSSGEGASGEASTPSGGGAEPATGWSWSTPPAAIADADISETIDTEIAV
ncbi:MAG: twin-arginine translocation signal domain-containing protein, partial [Bifidobacteriaceae bacterium]|nr:twin-arginine translocation signal domain-containing protein [Bifidobacteriaceae bacterium]